MIGKTDQWLQSMLRLRREGVNRDTRISMKRTTADVLFKGQCICSVAMDHGLMLFCLTTNFNTGAQRNRINAALHVITRGDLTLFHRGNGQWYTLHHSSGEEKNIEPDVVYKVDEMGGINRLYEGES